MEKLIKLLNEREKKEINQTYEWHNLGDFVFTDNVQTGQNLDSSESASILIAKKYGFIKRLVQNDKIDFDKVMKLGIPCFVQYDKGEIISVHDVDFDRQLIMLLSISDTPIQDLISYLK